MSKLDKDFPNPDKFRDHGEILTPMPAGTPRSRGFAGDAPTATPAVPASTSAPGEGAQQSRTAHPVPVDLIDPCPYQPRTQFEDEAMEALAENIREIGLRSPVEVRKKPSGRYELIMGERRLRAHKLNGSTTIFAFIEDVSDDEMFVRVGAENLARADLAPFEVAKYIKGLKDRGIAQNNRDLARLTGKVRQDIIRYLGYFGLPEAALAILEDNPGLIGATVAKDLSEYSRDHPEVVTAALIKVLGGTPQNKAAAWVKSQIEKRPLVESRREIVRPNGKRFAVVSSTAKRVSVTVDDESVAERVKAAVQELIDRYAGEADEVADE